MLSRISIFLCSAAIFCALTTASASAASYSVTATGAFACYDDDDLWALEDAKVEIMNSNSSVTDIFDQKIGTGYTDSSGRYTITGSGGDLLSKPDVYARTTLTDGSFTLRNGIGIAVKGSNWRSPKTDVSGSVSLGTLKLGSAGDSSECGVYEKTHETYQDYVSENGSKPPYGDLSVLYGGINAGTPWTLINTIQWPKGFSASKNNSEHEFGHSIRHSLDGGLSVFLYNVARFGYARHHDDCSRFNEGFAFNEGWAEYYAGDAESCGDGSDMSQEGNVATGLETLAKCPSIGSRKKMIAVLAAHPRQIYSYDDFYKYAKQMYPSCSSYWSTPKVTVPTVTTPSIKSQSSVTLKKKS